MEGYVDWRNFVIKEFEEVQRYDSLHIVSSFELPRGYVELDEVVLAIQRELRANAVGDGYYYDDRRGVTSTGASGASQEILLALSQAAIAGAATALFESLFRWAVESIRKDGQQYTYSTKSIIERVKEIIERDLNPQGNVEIVETLNTPLKVRLRDAGGNEYRAEVFEGGRIVKVTKRAGRRQFQQEQAS